MRTVTVSIIAWNDRQHLLPCLEAVRKQTYPSLRIFVIDNASTDGSAEAASRACPEATVLQAESNLGYTGAHNLAFSVTEDPYFLVLNADVTLAPDYVARLVAAMERDSGLGSVSGKLLRAATGTKAPAGVGDAQGAPVIDSAGIRADWRGRFRDIAAGLPDDGTRRFGEVFGVCGAAALYRREAILDSVPESEHGGRPFDADFFAYYEDADLSWSLWRRGWRARIERDAIALHVRGGSGARARRVEQLLHRNAFWLLLKHAEPWDLLRIAPGWLAYEALKALQSLTLKPWLLWAQRARLRGLQTMLARRRALQENARRPAKTTASLQAIEQGLRDVQARTYDAFTGGPYHDAVEIAACIPRLAIRRGDRVADLGCGTGRLLPGLLGQGARAVGADFSLASLRMARDKSPGALLVQADLTRLPFREGVFDRAVSLQVLHHLPDVQGRRAVITEAARILGKEGELVLTSYNDAILKRLLTPREGRHPGGIFYHRFRPDELQHLLEEHFETVEAAGIRHIPSRSIGERLFTLPGFGWLPRLDRRLEGSRLSRLTAHLWLIRGRKRAVEDNEEGPGPAEAA